MDVGIKDRALIESALKRAHATFTGQDLYLITIYKCTYFTSFLASMVYV